MSEHCGFLYNSILYDDCIARGQAMLSGTLETYGNVNTADSLSTIKKLVFEDQIITLSELTDVLKDDFKGHEEIREQYLNTIKYGNDTELVDFSEDFSNYRVPAGYRQLLKTSPQIDVISGIE